MSKFNDGMKSSAKDEWETPQDFFDRLNEIHQFTLDAAASAENAKCERYYTKEDDALVQPWPGRVWLNPPYGQSVMDFVKKACEESRKPETEVVVVLVAARTDTRWWHDWAMRASEIVLVRGRLRFGGTANSAPFPSAVLIFDKFRLEGKMPIFSTMKNKVK